MHMDVQTSVETSAFNFWGHTSRGGIIGPYVGDFMPFFLRTCPTVPHSCLSILRSQQWYTVTVPAHHCQPFVFLFCFSFCIRCSFFLQLFLYFFFSLSFFSLFLSSSPAPSVAIWMSGKLHLTVIWFAAFPFPRDRLCQAFVYVLWRPHIFGETSIQIYCWCFKMDCFLVSQL